MYKWNLNEIMPFIGKKEASVNHCVKRSKSNAKRQILNTYLWVLEFFIDIKTYLCVYMAWEWQGGRERRKFIGYGKGLEGGMNLVQMVKSILERNWTYLS